MCVAYQAILTRKHLENFASVPFPTYHISIRNNDKIVDGNILFLYIPLSSEHKLGKDISWPSLPERINNLLAELKLMTRILCMLKWTLSNRAACSAK